MIWSHKARMHWVCNDIECLTAEIYRVKNNWVWKVTNTNDGAVLTKRKAEHPVDAMDIANGYMKTVLDIRNAIKS